MWLILLLVLPIVALLLLGLVISTIVAVVFAVVAYLVPILLVLAGAWLLAKALQGSGDDRRARRAARHQSRSAPRTASRPSATQSPTSRQAAAPARRELPIDVQVKAEQIRHKVEVLLGYADRFAPFSQDLYIVRQTAADYLPRTIAAYLAIPGVDDPLIRATGRTALEELREQLRLLDSKLDEITQNLQRQDLDGLLANRRFLEERFGADERPASIETGRRGANVGDSDVTTRSA